MTLAGIGLIAFGALLVWAAYTGAPWLQILRRGGARARREALPPLEQTPAGGAGGYKAARANEEQPIVIAV